MGQIRIPRITTVDRTGLTMAVGELVYDTDDGEIYKGDGATAGGIIISGSGTVTSVTASTPLSSSGGATPNITIANAAADGTTKGAAAFTASDFNASSGVISIDYTNGQAASASNKGFLTSADWTTFNNKVTSVSATSPITSTGGATPSISTSMNTNKLIGRSTAGVGVMEEISIGTGLTLSAGTLSSASTNIKYGAATQASAGVYTSTITGVSAYTTGDVYVIKFDTVNDGASTLNINSIGAVNIYKNTSTPISSGDIKANQTVELVYDGTNFQAIGLIPSQLLAYVHNSEGAVINKGQVVYAYQATGNKMSVKLARADSDATSAKTIGLVYDSSIGIGGDGYIIIQGVIEGLNTAAYSAGDTLYLSGTTYGAMTNTKPYAPTHLVYVGIVEKANAGAGQIYVRCQNGYELDEIHNVDAFNPNNNDGIFYNTGTSLWEHKSIATVLGYTPASNAITISTSTPLSGGGDLSANRTISIADAVADGSTKGAATFTASDFNSSSGLISIDYANGQKASASQAGFLSSTDWSTFNGKEPALTKGNLTEATSSVLTISGGTGAVIGTGTSIQVKQSSGAQDGYLSSADWTTFNNKLSGNQTITLSGDVSGSGATSISTTIGAGAVTLSKMANLTANTIIGNNTGVAATPLALTGTQVTAMLDTFSTSATTKGLVTGSNGLGNTYFLRADGTWAVPAGGGGGGNPFSMNVVSVNTNAGSTADTHYFYLVSGTTTITLPTAVGNTSIYTIKRTGVNNVQVATTSSQTIDGGAAPITLTVQYQSLNFVSDGSNWAIF